MNIYTTITYQQLLEEEARAWYEYITSRDCTSVRGILWDSLEEIRAEINRRNEIEHEYLLFHEI